MRTATITLHDTNNAGSSLQSYALQHFLLENGIENEIIDYVPRYVETNGRLWKTLARKLIYWRESKEQKQNFQLFKQQFLKVTPRRYRTYEELIQDPPFADCFIAGSDQIWNASYACGRDPAFYLEFAKGPKISYAASIGKEEIPEEEQVLYSRFLQGYHAISVREQSSQVFLSQQLQREIGYVCDPVLLNPVETYRSIQSSPLIREPYALVYLVAPGELLEKTLRRIREEYGCKIVLIGGFKEKCPCDYHLRSVGPQDFHSLIDHSRFVLSSSFHATVFSHIYEKNFAVIPPSRNQARMRQFLEVSGLQEHLLEGESEISGAIAAVDFYDARVRLREFIMDSQKWLLNCLDPESIIDRE